MTRLLKKTPFWPLVALLLLPIFARDAAAQGAAVIPYAGHVKFIDHATGEVTTLDNPSLDPQFHPMVTVHHATHTAYVLGKDSSYPQPWVITVIDTATKTIVRRMTTQLTSDTLVGIIVNPSNGALYVRNNSGTLFTLSTVNGAVMGQAQTGFSTSTPLLAVHPSGAYVYVGLLGFFTKVVDVATQTVTATLPVGGPMSFTADGSLLIAAATTVKKFSATQPEHPESGSVLLLRPGDLRAVSGYSATFTHSGTRLHIVQADFASGATLATYSTTTGTLLRRSSSMDLNSFSMAASPDGTRLYLINIEGDESPFRNTSIVFNTSDLSLRSSVDINAGLAMNFPLNDFTGAAATLPDPLDTANDQIAQLHDQLDSLEQQLADAQDANGQLTAQVSDLLTQLGNANARIAQLEDQVAALTPAAGNFAAQIVALQTQLTAAQAMLLQLQLQVSTLTSDKTALTARVASLTQERDAWKGLVPSNQSSPAPFFAYVPAATGVARVPLGGEPPASTLATATPTAVAVHLGKQLLATFDNNNFQLKLSDLPSGEVLANGDALLFSITAMFFNHSGERLLVAHSGGVSIFETVSAHLIKFIPVANGAAYLASSDDGQRLFASSSSKISAINGNTLQVSTTRTLSSFIYGMTTTPSGDRVYVGTPGALLELDGLTLQTLRTVNASLTIPIFGGAMLTMNRSASRLFVMAGGFPEATLLVFDTASLTLVRPGTLLNGGPGMFALHPDGSRVLHILPVQNGSLYDMSIQAFDAATGDLLSTTPIPSTTLFAGDFAGSQEAMPKPEEAAFLTVAAQAGEIGTLNGIITSKNDDLSAKTTQITTLTNEKTALTIANTSLLSDNTALTNANALLKGERDALAADKAALTTERDALIADKNALTAERDALIVERNALRADKTSLTAERDALIVERDGLRGERDALLADKNALTAERDQLVIDKAALQQRNSDLEGEKQTLLALNTTLTEQKATLEAQNTALAAAKAAVESERDALQQQNTTLQQQNSTLQAQYNTLQRAKDALQAQYNTLQQAKDTLQQQYDSVQAQVATLVSQNATLQSDLAAAGQTIASLQAMLGNGQASLQLFEAAFQRAFNMPGFHLPGTTVGEKVQALVNAISALNHGQQQALFKNLGGR